MRAVYAILLCLVFCPFLSARADVITNTSSSIRVGGVAVCSSSSPTHSTCSTSIGDGGGNADATADLYTAGVSAFAFGLASISGPRLIASAEAEIDGEYVLYGGTGMGSFDISYTPFFDQGPNIFCSLVIDGGSVQSCENPVTVVTVEYGVPFTMDLDLSASAESAPRGEGVLGEASVNFAQPGLSATPEPSSILLLMPGLAGVMLAAKSRLRVG